MLGEGEHGKWKSLRLQNANEVLWQKVKKKIFIINVRTGKSMECRIMKQDKVFFCDGVNLPGGEINRILAV